MAVVITTSLLNYVQYRITNINIADWAFMSNELCILKVGQNSLEALPSYLLKATRRGKSPQNVTKPLCNRNICLFPRKGKACLGPTTTYTNVFSETCIYFMETLFVISLGRPRLNGVDFPVRGIVSSANPRAPRI
jgi:hypothetical protein